MSNLSQFLGGGGGLTPKFQEFNASGTFTPSAALIAAGGYIEVFLVGGGGNSGQNDRGGSGGETILTQMNLTSTAGISVVIGAGGESNFFDGGNSTFNGASAGGSNKTALGGSGSTIQNQRLGAGWGASLQTTAGCGVLGYGAGSQVNFGGIQQAKVNSGQGVPFFVTTAAGSGYCLVKFFI